LARAYQRLGLFKTDDAHGPFTWVGPVLPSSPPSALTLAVAETSSRSPPRPEGRKYIVWAASDPAVASHASADRRLWTEPQVFSWFSGQTTVERLHVAASESFSKGVVNGEGWVVVEKAQSSLDYQWFPARIPLENRASTARFRFPPPILTVSAARIYEMAEAHLQWNLQ
jgi:hypothetical protein